ncbi:MAG: ankyrin repeat domain-containing protein [Spirochaetia bacterium]|nr:ankyrin repeat domain-containing protein [Spirochaetia bacterium]
MRRRFLLFLSLIAIFMFITASVSAYDDPKEMLKAIEAGDAAGVKAMLDGGFDPNTFMPNGQPAVMAAANVGNADIVSLFIKAGADISLRADDALGGNALTGAVWSNRETHDPANTIKIIQILLDAGIDINSGEIRDESGDYESAGKIMKSYKNPIWFAACSSDYSADVIEFMMNRGCTLSGSFAISESGDERHDFGVDKLSDDAKKSKTNKADRKEYNRIQKVLKNAEKSTVPAVMVATNVTKAEPEKPVAAPPQHKEEPKPAKAKAKKPVKEEPKPVEPTSTILSESQATEMLFKSVQNGKKENFYRSLVMGADINAADKDNKTALLLAVMAQNYEMTEVLIYKGAEVNVKSKGGNTPLSMSRDLGAKDIEQLLLKAGAKE